MPAAPHPFDDDARLVERVSPTVGAPVLLVPVGSTEQHGPHLPLDTDSAVATAVAEGLATRLRATGVDAVVAPGLSYGSSGEHQDFPGTLSIGTPALQLVLVELARSATTWAPRVVFVNGHGGNLDALTSAVALLRSEGRDVAWVPCAAADGATHDVHAGFDETSLLARLRPDSVRLDRAEAGVTTAIGDLLPRLRADGVRAVAPNGILGDPTGATPEAGAELLAAMIEAAWRRLDGAPTGGAREAGRG